MAKATKKKQLSRKEIEEAAEIASQEAIDELGIDTTEDDTADSPFTAHMMAEPDESYAEDDVFEESFKRAVALNTAPKFYIKKNSQFLCVKGWPYSWEKLQAEYGEGYYQVIAKAQNNGRIIKKQSEMVGDPSGGVVEEEEEDTKPSTDGNMAYLAMMNQFQERADAKAQAQARSGESSMATIMQTVMTIQAQTTQMMMQQNQENNKQFQALILAMNQPKGPDPMLTLVTTLLTQKPKDDNGFTTANVLKMIQDAETRAETRANKTQEQIEKKADSLAEMKLEAMQSGEGEAEESGLKGLIKGFVPVITQMIANNQAAQAQGPQPTPEQIAQLQENRRFHAQNQALDQGFIEKNRRAAPQPAQRPQPVGVNPNVGAAPQGGPVNTQNTQNVKPVTPIAAVKPVQPNSTQELVWSDRQKREVFDACAGDIGKALVEGSPASQTAGLITEKLEKEGLSRQAISKAYKLEDFYGYAVEYGLPDEVKPWLKEFHESLQKMASQIPIRTASAEVIVTGGPGGGSSSAKVVGPVGTDHSPREPANKLNGSAKPVSGKRTTPERNQRRAQPRGHTKDF